MSSVSHLHTFAHLSPPLTPRTVVVKLATWLVNVHQLPKDPATMGNASTVARKGGLSQSPCQSS